MISFCKRRDLNVLKEEKITYHVSVILFVALMCLAIYDRTFYDRSKDNIFEIPKAHHLIDDRDGGYIYETYFFIQKVPESEDKLEDEIRTFISENKIIEEAKSAGANSLTLKFMEPDFRMPVYFKENSSFIKKDDYAEHYYKTNMTAIYNYDFDDDTEMMDFYKVKHSL